MLTLLKKALVLMIGVVLWASCGASPKVVAKPQKPASSCDKAPAAPKADPASAYLDIDTCGAHEGPASQPDRKP